jgi:DNA-binding SARP family transcriptional activator/tetratricopeptide (TPR) repeat protein
MTQGDGIRVRLFGRPEVTRIGSGKFFPEKGIQLITLAALHPQRRIARKTAATLIWDTIEESAALNNLRQLLARMRQQYAELDAILSIDVRNISISGNGGSIDVCRFFDSNDSQLFRLYPGSLLEGLGDVSQTFAEWVQVERTRLQEHFFRRCESHLLDITRLGSCAVETIIEFEARLLALEPAREASFRVLIEAYGRSGHTREAARLSRALVAVTKAEHGTTPQVETEAAVRRVLASAVAADSVKPTETRSAHATPPRVAFLQPRWGNIGALAEENLKALIEDLVNELSRYRTFVMLAPHSSFQIEHDTGLPLNNQTLRADFTVSGFMKPGGSLSLRMVHVASQAIVWAGEFPAQPEHVLTCYIQLIRRIAANLASGIEKHFNDEIQMTGDRNSYQAYLAGQLAMQDCNLANLRRARKFYRESISHDPGFASAYARVGQTLYQEWLMTGADDATLLASARSQTEHALERDGNSGLARWMGGVVSMYQRDFDACEQNFEAAAVLCPNSPELLLQHGDALANLGDADAGMRKFETALEINPLPPEHYWWAGASIAFYQSDYRRAIDLCGRMKNDESVLRILASANALVGNLAEARDYGRRLKENYPSITASSMSKFLPERKPTTTKAFVEGLRMAGIN